MRKTFNRERYLTAILYMAAPVVMLFLIEVLNRKTAYVLPTTRSLTANLFWLSCFFLLAYSITKKRFALSFSLTSLIVFGMGIANHYAWRSRDRMLQPADFLHVKTAAAVSGSYNMLPDLVLVLCILIFAGYVILLFRHPIKRKSFMKGWDRRAFPLGFVIFLLIFMLSTMPDDLGLEPLTPQTRNRGFVNEFMIQLRFSFLKAPEEYSEDVVEDIQDDLEEEFENEDRQGAESSEDGGESKEKNDEETVKPTNIIVIMNESMGDYSIFPGFKASEDPLSYLHSLMKTCISGHIVSPVYGGGTANAEYEFLTGNNCSFLPDGAIAYETYMDKDIGSLAVYAGAAGYKTTAFHSYESLSWNREEAYECEGFDQQLYEEDMEDAEHIGLYTSDASDYSEVIRIAESTDEPQFIFNVTVQNHGGYSEEREGLTAHIDLSDELEEADPDAELYFSLLKESDNALKELIEYFEDSDEPTMICIFGDHQPTLTEEFYDLLYGKTVDERTDREVLEQYMTPFCIWTNYGEEKETDLTISLPELGIRVAEEAGIETSYYARALAKIYDELPVIHRFGIISKDGAFTTDADNLSSKNKTLIREYRMLQYYNLKDREEGEDEDFFVDLNE